MKVRRWGSEKVRKQYKVPFAFSYLLTFNCFFRRHVPAVTFRQFVFHGMVFQIYLVQRIGERLERLLAHLGLKLAFPHSYAVPAHARQGLLLFAVAAAVALYLRAPEGGVALRQAESGAVVPVPEASVYEYARAVFAQHQVRMAGQARTVQPVPEAAGEQIPAHNQLGPRVFRPYRGHDLAAFFFRK